MKRIRSQKLEGRSPGQQQDLSAFWLIVKPRASREGLSKTSSGDLCLAIHAPPTDGLANEACIRFLAVALGVPKASIEIVAGGHSRRKLMRVTGAPDAVRRLEALASGRRSDD